MPGNAGEGEMGECRVIGETQGEEKGGKRIGRREEEEERGGREEEGGGEGREEKAGEEGGRKRRRGGRKMEEGREEEREGEGRYSNMCLCTHPQEDEDEGKQEEGCGKEVSPDPKETTLPPRASIHLIPPTPRCQLAPRLYVSPKEEAGLRRLGVCSVSGQGSRNSVVWQPSSGTC